MNFFVNLFSTSFTSLKYYISIFIIFFITIFYFDFYSVIFLLFLIVVSYLNFGIDSKVTKLTNNTSHGINENKSSRLGGVLIFVFILLNFLNNTEINIQIFSPQELQFYFIIIFFITFLGFVDDIIGGLNHLFKLYFLSFSIIILLITNNNFIVSQSNMASIDFFLDNTYFAFCITFIIILGFINASNISDGANGILSGVGCIFILAVFFETYQYYYLIIFKFLFIFYLYNTIVSKVFLGDSGSYFLGFLISTLSLYFYNQSIFSAGFFASLLSYPCLEIIYSIFRRFYLKKNPLRADNKHLHNLMFSNLKSKIKILSFANTITGLIITILFSLPAFLFLIIIKDPLSNYFWYIFLTQCLIYVFIYKFLSNNSAKKH